MLVALDQLRLCGVGHSADAGRQYIVDRSLVVVLLDVHCADLQSGPLCRSLARVKCLLIGSPVAMNQVQGGQTQDDILMEARQEHAHEAYAGEVLYVAHLLLVAAQRDAEQIPGALFGVAVAQLHAGRTLVCYMVASHNHVLGTDAHVILVILLVFVERIILVDVLHVRRALPGRLV